MGAARPAGAWSEDVGAASGSATGVLRQEEVRRGTRQEETLLDLQGVSKSYDGWSKALDDVSMSIRRGEFVGIIGSSGAGKSTLLRCVNRLIDPSQGAVMFDGRDVTRERGRALRQIRRRISMVFQHYNLVYRATAIENVLHGRLGYRPTLAGMLGQYREEEKRRAFEILDQVGLADFAYTRIDQLSGGQKQRVGIARALVQDPLLILADEPIASLDPKSSRTVMEHLRRAADELGIACLVNLHQVDFARGFSDRIVGLKGGKLVFDGVPGDLDTAAIAAIYGADEREAADAPAADCMHYGRPFETAHRFEMPIPAKEGAA